MVAWPGTAAAVEDGDEAFLSLSSLRAIYVGCVQSSLNKLGFNAGVVDGVVGRRTRRSARSYQRTFSQASDLQRLSTATAPQWCEYLSGAHEEVAANFARVKEHIDSIPGLHIVSGDPGVIWVQLSSQTNDSIASALTELIGKSETGRVRGNGKQNTLLVVFNNSLKIGDKVTVQHRYVRPWSRRIPPIRFDYNINKNTPQEPLIIMNSATTQGKGGSLIISLFVNEKIISESTFPIVN
ncbi:MAG: peptidoglycan-binding protein [Rhizobiaceae bacterium]